ncbi:MAG TPA: ATP-binding protein [Vicinamibacterales bacterium]|nr:ATP-binding protein [Vicinamibacterales bacterium]
MTLSLRTRLTAWYAVLLMVTVAVFSTAVLWLHWRLLLEQFDESLTSIGATADNVVEEELGELHDLGRVAAEMAAVVHPPDYVVQVLDASGSRLGRTSPALPLPTDINSPEFPGGTRTLSAGDGAEWRVTIRRGAAEGVQYFVAVGAPLDGATEQWRTLLRACLIGIPLALGLAIGGGLWLGWHGLRPLTSMGMEAQAITATTLDTRLTVPRATELEQLARSFNIVLGRLGSALSTQRRFMADASHELRTPISILRTAADVTLSRPVRDEEEYREALSAISQQASRLTRLVDDMLVLARADGAGYPVVLAPVDLTALVSDCVRELRPPADGNGITVRTSLESVMLEGDDTLLRRMFSNLFGNAVKYTPSGGSIEVSLTKAGREVVLRVADTGPGIPAGDRERVFERFVRLDPARGAGGVGLGLAIARWVAEAHGGRLQLVSSGPGGSVFAVSFPV